MFLIVLVIRACLTEVTLNQFPGRGNANQGVFGAFLGAILGAWTAMLGGGLVHVGPWKGHVADLGAHLVAKRAAKSQHEQPKPERCRFLVDIAQKSSNQVLSWWC